MSNIIDISKKTNDSSMTTPVQILNDMIEEFKEGGEFENNKEILVLTVDRSNDSYHVRFTQAGMRMSDCITVCEVAKTVFLSEMEYI